MSLRYSPKPVVVAPFQMVFGGGCEMVLHADRVRAAAETYIGLVEVGVGIIPAGGGTKEMLVRAMDSIPADMKDADPFPFVKRAFETIALAKVATSAEEARDFGFLREDDTISMNADRLIADAKKEVLALAASRIRPAAAAHGYSGAGRAGAGDFETRHASDEARWLYFRSRRVDWREARADSDRWRFESRDARHRAVPARSRARSFPFADRHAQDAGADRAYVEDGKAVTELVRLSSECLTSDVKLSQRTVGHWTLDSRQKDL